MVMPVLAFLWRGVEKARIPVVGRTYFALEYHRSRWRIEFDDGSLSWYERQVGRAVLDCVEWPHHPNEIFDRESNKTKFSILTIMPCAATALSPIGYIQRLSRV